MQEVKKIRNFVIIAHIDHGKSTLADRMLEITGTVEKRRMREQYLDQLELERERGITIKMAPVRMIYHSDRRPPQTETLTNADSLLFEDLTYKIRGAVFTVKKNLGLGHKETLYQRALEEEFKKQSLSFEKEKSIDLFYENKKIGTYRPDFVVEDKVILELKALPFIGQTEEKQLWSYIKGSPYKLALLVNFGAKDVEFRRMVYETARLRESASSQRLSANSEYILNLIDTPGHSDFSYEVSRALAAVQGAILLVDAVKGIQAQTLSNFRAAQKAGLEIIGAVNKIDLNPPRLEAAIDSLAELLKVPREEIFRVSGKTGTGVEDLLHAVVRKVPCPSANSHELAGKDFKALVFDSIYDDHKGILAFIRNFQGSIKSGDEIQLLATKTKLKVKEVGYFLPEYKSTEEIKTGEIGYIATGLKEPALLRIGDTASSILSAAQLPGYREPAPVVFISFYPDRETSFEDLKRAMERLRLNDSALTFEPDANQALGRGIKVGFLGQLHFEITSDRLRREFKLEFLTSFPTIAYRIKDESGERIVKQMNDWPEKPDWVLQPMIKLEILTPASYMSQVLNLKNIFEIDVKEVENLGDNVVIGARMPLSELIRDFDDQLKSVSQGYASFSYELDGEDEADVKKMEILIAGEVQPALTRIIMRKDVEREARQTVERLKELLSRVQFAQAIQAVVDGRVIARETIPALRKDVTGYLYGGDRSRKMKLWKKQQRGKERLKQTGRVNLGVEVFREILKK